MLRPAARALGRLIEPPYRHAAIVISIAVIMASLFALSYSLALGRPSPHQIPAGIVGDPRPHLALEAALEAQTHGALVFHPYPSVAAAKHAISEQQIYAALLLTPPGARLLIASAAGTSVARLLEQAVTKIAQSPIEPLQVVDLYPLPSTDPQGLVSFYVTLAATILGFVTMFQLRGNAPALSLRAWLGCIVAVAVIGGLLLALVSDPLIGALRAPFPELWAALAAQVAVAALFNSTMITLFGPWAIIPTWGFFVALGNAASGGAVAPPLLPSFYAFIGRFLPAGATIEIIRNAVYFRHYQHLEPLIVEALWLVGTFAALMVATRIRGQRPDKPRRGRPRSVQAESCSGTHGPCQPPYPETN